MRPEKHEPGEAVHAGHRKVEKDEVDIVVVGEFFDDALEASRFADDGLRMPRRDGLTQRVAKQRMIVRYQEPVRPGARLCRLPPGARLFARRFRPW